MSRGGSDVDNGVAHTRANTGTQVAGGVNGFKLLGITLGLAVHSRALGSTMGAYGAGMSVYSRFLARAHEVRFPKNTGDGDWGGAAAEGNCWHGVQDLGSSRSAETEVVEKLKSSQNRLSVTVLRCPPAEHCSIKYP